MTSRCRPSRTSGICGSSRPVFLPAQLSQSELRHLPTSHLSQSMGLTMPFDATIAVSGSANLDIYFPFVRNFPFLCIILLLVGRSTFGSGALPLGERASFPCSLCSHSLIHNLISRMMHKYS